MKLSCIPTLNQLHDYTAFSKEYHAAFEYNDFFLPSILDNDEQKKRIMETYMNLDRDKSNDTMHGTF